MAYAVFHVFLWTTVNNLRIRQKAFASLKVAGVWQGFLMNLFIGDRWRWQAINFRMELIPGQRCCHSACKICPCRNYHFFHSGRTTSSRTRFPKGVAGKGCLKHWRQPL